MAVSRITPKRVRNAKPKDRQYSVWDKKLKGFGFRVALSGRKAFVVNTTRNGVRHIETIGDTRTMTVKEARALAKVRIRAIAALGRVGPASPFEDVAEIVMRRMERLWKPRTTSVRRGYLRCTILPYFKGRRIDSITRRDVDEWFASLRDKPAAANYCVPFLSVIMRGAEDLGARPEGSNPMIGLRRYRLRKRDRVLTPDEMVRLGRALEERRSRFPIHAACIRMIILTGCRKGELIDLEWRDYRKGHLHLRDSKIGPRTVFLSPEARAVLDEVGTPRPGRVFPSPRYSRVGITLEPFWQGLRREIGLDDVRLHDLRHHYTSTAVRMGVSLEVVGRLLGHSDPQTTLGYAHLDDSDVRDAAETVCRSMAAREGDGQ